MLLPVIQKSDLIPAILTIAYSDRLQGTQRDCRRGYQQVPKCPRRVGGPLPANGAVRFRFCSMPTGYTPTASPGPAQCHPAPECGDPGRTFISGSSQIALRTLVASLMSTTSIASLFRREMVRSSRSRRRGMDTVQSPTLLPESTPATRWHWESATDRDQQCCRRE
jgi:hypothetical protein